MTTDAFYQSIAEGVLGGHPSDEDALVLMILLHTYRLRLAGGVLTDRPGVYELSAITQRHAAEVIAAAWPARADPERTTREHWYYLFNNRTPFETVEDIPPEWSARVQRALNGILSSGLVRAAEPED